MWRAARIAIGVLLLGLAAVGCRSSERRLRDTEGRSFIARCQRSGVCELSQTEGPRRADGKGDLALKSAGRLIGICDVTGSAEPESFADCRPLVCKTDGDCPPEHGLRDGQCLNGHCADAANAVDANDSIMLCLAGTGLGREQPRQIERYALGLNCGTPCSVPRPCQEP
jgi:hypothetical protein